MADEKRPPDSQSRDGSHGLGKAYGMGIEFAAAVGGFCLLGYMLDKWLGSYPKAFITCALLGIIGGMYNLIRQALVDNREAEARKARNNNRESDDRKSQP